MILWVAVLKVWMGHLISCADTVSITVNLVKLQRFATWAVIFNPKWGLIWNLNKLVSHSKGRASWNHLKCLNISRKLWGCTEQPWITPYMGNISFAVIIILTDRQIDPCLWLGTSVKTWKPTSWHEKDAGKGNGFPNVWEKKIYRKSFFCSRFSECWNLDDQQGCRDAGMQSLWTASGGWQRNPSISPADNPLKSQFQYKGSKYNGTLEDTGEMDTLQGL